jgi:hypothetical protein
MDDLKRAALAMPGGHQPAAEQHVLVLQRTAGL